MTFEKRYKTLNIQQKMAVDAIEGPVMVIAGPGTGKTSILTLRIANILKKTDTEPDNILALTFTESGAYSMRKKLADIIGSSAYKVNIYTFHGFCNDIIKNYPEEFPRIIGANNITDIDQIKILEEIIDSTKLEILKPYGDIYHYVRSIISEINNIKQENISPKDLLKRIQKQKKDFDVIPDLYHEKGQYKGRTPARRRFLDVAIDWKRVSDFQHAVYLQTLAIRAGCKASYGEIARALALGPESARAVGVALATNPWPLLVPCHRIVSAKDTMTGFSGPGGVRTKTRLLALEGAELLSE